jgi:hypothetical protein
MGGLELYEAMVYVFNYRVPPRPQYQSTITNICQGYRTKIGDGLDESVSDMRSAKACWNVRHASLLTVLLKTD